jgi:predicted nucleic acid-binding protein
MSTVIADSGPLMVLAKLNLLHLLKLLYGRVHFTPAVYTEVVGEGIRLGYEDAHTLQRFLALEHWKATAIPSIPVELAALRLDRGERESIALAIALNGVLLMDEERGRQVARQRGLTVHGTLGVLIQAYRSGHIGAEQLRFYFGQIEEHSDIWISPTLCRRLLSEVLGAMMD